MRANVFYRPRDLRLEQVPEPKISEAELLLRVAACGGMDAIAEGQVLKVVVEP